jgi:outer membrane protein OmpA-like peptidoglycan-associated protein
MVLFSPACKDSVMRRLAVLLLLCLGACTASEPPASQRFVVYFEEWSAGLDGNAQKAITGAAQWARQHPTEAVTVTGFADPQGSQKANIDLSRTRAQVVVDQLTRDGVEPGRISLAARGITDFTLSSLESRRVEIAVAGR